MKPDTYTNEPAASLRAPGDLLSTNAESLRLEADNLFETQDGKPREWNVLHLDLTAAGMVDSVGLNLIVYLLRKVEKRGGRMRITYSSPNVLRTFSFTRLDKHVDMVKA